MKDSFKKLLRTEIKGIPHESQWAAFLLPVFLLCAAFLSYRIHPLGESSLLTCDLFHQYAPILAEIRTKVMSGDSLFYTWNMGLGTNFWTVFSYYGASPMNVTLLFFPQEFLSDGITLMILLRTGLSGLFFSLLLYKKDGHEGSVSLALSTIYALCGYVLAYFWNLMWMDAVVLLPLVILGLYKLFTGDKPRLFVITLFLVIFSNFYTGFFVCLFLVLFAPVLYLEARQRSVFTLQPVMAGLRFAGYSFLAGGMSAVLLIPTIIALKNTSAAGDTITITADLSFTLFDFFSRFLLHADPVIREGLPNVYSGAAILLLIPLYVLCRTIPFSRRMLSIGLVFIIYISMNSKVLDYYLHGMHNTNQLPYRQAFLMCFLLLYLASQVLLHFDGVSKKMIYYAGMGVLFYLVILSQSGDIQKNYWLIFGSAAFVIVYTMILSGFFASEKGRKRAHKAFLYAVILEMFLSSEFALAYIEKTEHFTYAASYGQYAALISKDISAADGGLFSRTVLMPPLTGNDGALYHVKTVAVFASTTPVKFVQFMGGLGFGSNQKFELEAAGLTDVSARLLGIRNTVNFVGGKSIEESKADGTFTSPAAVLGTSSISASPTEDMMYSGYEITTDEKALPIGFFVPFGSDLTALDSSVSPFEQTNALFTGMGTQAVYEKGELNLVSSSNIEKSSDMDTYTIMTNGQTSSISLTPGVSSGDTDVLLYLGTRQESTVRITRMDGSSGKNTVDIQYPSAGQIINCGKVSSTGEATMTVQVLFSDAVSETFPIYCYSINEEALDSASDALRSQPLTVVSFDSTHLFGSVDFAKDGSLFTSIPYDAGWTVKVDGKTVKTQAAYGALLSVPVSKGFHEIEFSYQPPGFLPGLLISLILTADFVLLCIWNPLDYIMRKRMNRSELARTDEKEEKQ